jgi:poly [ADP-ribose] polymerase
MTATKVEERLIYTDLNANNNKFWHIEQNDTTLTANWGRVGDAGQRKVYVFDSATSAEAAMQKQVAAKLRKGYTRQHTISSNVTPPVTFVAKVQIDHGNDPETSALIDFLVKRNIHKIEGMTSIRLEAGRLTTPLGPVTSEGLDEAEKLLVLMSRADNTNIFDLANQYLRIIPRNIGRNRIDPNALFGTQALLEAEQALIDSLRAVVKDAEQKAAAQSQAAPPVFATKLELIQAGDTDWKRVSKYYRNGINRNHVSSRMELHSVWKMRIDAMADNFDQKIGNVKELWHGTKDANLLSILKNGYVIAGRNSGIHISGRMFGDGMYFSDQSTKSLNYTTGFWGGQKSQRAFMLLNDVAMGKEYIPGGKGGNGVGRTLPRFTGKLPKGYDSCFAKAGTSGVINNEMIVYDTRQINPTYLCEFR